MKNKSFKMENLIFIAVISVMILAFSLSYFIKDEKSFSEEENRMLATFPSFSFEKLSDGTYFEQLHNFYNDQMPLRNEMIAAKALSELVIGKNENNSIILAKDGYLIEKHEYTDKNYDCLQKNLESIENFRSKLNISNSLFLIPRKIDLLDSYLPPYYSAERAGEAWKIADGFQYISLENDLLDAQKNGTQLFYKTDHHWTAEGAYHAYLAIAEKLGVTPIYPSEFTMQELSNEFYGTTYSKSGMFFLTPDTISIPNIAGSSKYVTEIVETGERFDGFYDFSYLEKKDKYSLYISGNNAHVKVYDTRENNKETLLLVKDSFSHALVPYLAQNYNLEIIDLRYYSDQLSELINEIKPDEILFIYGLDTIATSEIRIR